jgi:signal transduction histidine kinase
MKFYLYFLLIVNFPIFGQFYDEKYTTQELILRTKKFKTRPQTIKNQYFYCESLVNLASRYNKIQRFDSSLALSNESLPLAEKLQNHFLIASSKLNIGHAYEGKELYFIASKYFEETIHAAKLAKNDSLLALSYYLGGLCYNDQKAYKQALLMLKQGEILCKEKKIYNQLTRCLNISGIIYEDLKRPHVALRYFRDCLNISEKYQIQRMIPISYKNIGKVLLYTNTPQEGVENIKKSIELFLQSPKKSINDLVIYSYFEMAKYYHFKQDIEQANRYAKLGFEINKTLNFSDLQLEFSKILYENYSHLGNTSEALKYLIKYKDATDKVNKDLLDQQRLAVEERVKSIYNQNQVIRLNREKEVEKKNRNFLIISILCISLFTLILLLLYQTIKKQKSKIEEINQGLEHKVQERTAELQQAYDEIKEALTMGQSIERKRVAAALHDNLGSMLSAIGIHLEIIDEDRLNVYEQRNFREIKKKIEDAYQEVRLLSHNLHPENLENHGLKFALEKFKDKINATQKINLSLDTQQLPPLSKKIEFNLYAICLELVNNTIKHSKATLANIIFYVKDNEYFMEYTDNGNGFNKNKQEGFGLKSIRNRVQEMGATSYWEESGGVIFKIIFPL